MQHGWRADLDAQSGLMASVTMSEYHSNVRFMASPRDRDGSEDASAG
jgi:hypothetical protein